MAMKMQERQIIVVSTTNINNELNKNSDGHDRTNECDMTHAYY